MKIRLVTFLTLLVVVRCAVASEPITCYQIATQHLQSNGLGLTSDQAVDLCGGTRNADETIQCFTLAWSNIKKRGLGLTVDQGISLCKHSMPAL